MPAGQKISGSRATHLRREIIFLRVTISIPFVPKSRAGVFFEARLKDQETPQSVFIDEGELEDGRRSPGQAPVGRATGNQQFPSASGAGIAAWNGLRQITGDQPDPRSATLIAQQWGCVRTAFSTQR